MSKCFFCLTSSHNAISDGFKKIALEFSKQSDVIIIGTSFCIPAEIRNNKNVFLFDYDKSFSGLIRLFSLIFRIRFIFNRFMVDNLFIYSSLPINFIIAWLVSSKVKIFWWIHDPETHSGEKKWVIHSKKLNDYFLLKNKKLYKVVVASKYLKNLLLKKDIPEHTISVIQFPILTELVNAIPYESKTRKDVIFFGRIESYKGVEWFLDALNEHGLSLGIDCNTVFHIIGKGEILFDFCKFDNKFKFNVANYYVPNDKLAGFILQSKVAIFPYRDATGTQAIQSAGALGALPVLTRIDGLMDSIIKDYSYTSCRDNQYEFIENIVKALAREISDKTISESYVNKFSNTEFINKIKKLIWCIH